MFFSVFFLITSCDSLFDNPYDSKANPDSWKPDSTDYYVVSPTICKLSWTQENEHIDGFKIDKYSSGEWVSEYASVSKNDREWYDNDYTYQSDPPVKYRIYAVAGSNKSVNLEVLVNPQLPEVRIDSVIEVNESELHLYASIVCENKAAVIEKGICWATSENPVVGTIYNSDEGSGTGAFESYVSDLPDGSFYFRAYAINAAGTSYSSNYISNQNIPKVTTGQISNITSTTANCGGNVINEGASSVTMKGVCWSTNPYPTNDNVYYRTIDGSGVGEFISEITGLSNNTTYYVRAYAINTYGTGYGEQVIFTTEAGLPYIATSLVTDITANTAICGGYGISDGGSAIISKGVCWSTQGNPTINDSKTNDGSTTADFVSSITNLNPETTYYVRAYAINSNGVNYGSQRIFETLPISCGNNVSDADGNIYETVQIGSQCWLKSNLSTTKFSDNTNIALVEGNSWGSLTSAAFCYYQNNYSNYGETYGALYNWYAVSSNKLCPLGWHVPSDEEWLELATFCNGVDGAGGMLKEEGTNHWNSPNTGASNYYSFTALPGGGRMPGGPLILFEGINDDCNLWTSTSYNSTRSIYFNMSSQTALLYRNNWDNNAGFSVRCVKD